MTTCFFHAGEWEWKEDGRAGMNQKEVGVFFSVIGVDGKWWSASRLDDLLFMTVIGKIDGWTGRRGWGGLLGHR